MGITYRYVCLVPKLLWVAGTGCPSSITTVFHRPVPLRDTRDLIRVCTAPLRGIHTREPYKPGPAIRGEPRARDMVGRARGAVLVPCPYAVPMPIRRHTGGFLCYSYSITIFPGGGPHART